MRIMLLVYYPRVISKLLLVSSAEEALSISEDVSEESIGGAKKLRIQDWEYVVDTRVIPVDNLLEAAIPAFDISLYKHDFCFWVCRDKLVGEADGRAVRHGAIFAQQIVPVWARERTPIRMVLGFEGAGPDRTIGDIVKSCVAVVAGRATEGFEGGLHCFGRVSMA